MIVDIRTYTLVARKLPTYVSMFESLAMPVMRKHKLELMGYYTSVIGPLNQVVHLWRYENLAAMELIRAARDLDGDWAYFQKMTEGMVLMQEKKIMKPTEFSPSSNTF